MLFADCEGLNGGERIPRGLKHRTFTRDEASGIRPTLRPLLHVESKAKLKRSRYSSQRNILWASTPAMKKREYSVTQLYPRLLYTFSDVVVFVLRNPRYDFFCVDITVPCLRLFRLLSFCPVTMAICARPGSKRILTAY